jgi:hypothetical protein
MQKYILCLFFLMPKIGLGILHPNYKVVLFSKFDTYVTRFTSCLENIFYNLRHRKTSKFLSYCIENEAPAWQNM